MKNFKKVLALVLALSMVLSTMTAFAAEYETEGDVLYDLGLLQGYSTTEKELGLEDALSREAAMKLIVTMMGWEVDMDAASDFEDVSEWAQPYVAVAVEKGITNGISDTEFGTDQATRVQLLTWYVRALGYEVEWVDADQFEADVFTYAVALELGSLDELLKLDEAVLRGDLAGVAYAALTADVNDSETTLIEDLVEAGVVEEEAAVAYDLVEEPAPVVFEVVNVKPLNLVETVITFSGEVDSDELGTIEVDGTAITEANADGNEVVVFHGNVANQETVTVEVKDVKNIDGDTAADFEGDYQYTDLTPPEVEDFEVIGEKTVRLTFDEPMDVKADSDDAFTVKKSSGARVYIKSVTQSASDYKAVDVLFVSTLKDDEEYTVSLGTSLEDFAGFGTIFNTEFTFTPNDEELEVVDFEEASVGGVTLVFNKDLKDEAITASKVTHTNSKNIADTVTVNGDKLEITFPSDSELPEGTAYIYIEADTFEDLWGNANDAIKATIVIEQDTTAPVVDTVEAGASLDEIVVTFEVDDLDKDSAEDTENYVVYDADGEEVEIKDIDLDNDNKTVTLEFEDELSGDYLVVISDVEDTEGNVMEDAEFEVAMEDGDAPSLSTTKFKFYTVDSYNVIIIDYPEAMSVEGDYSVLDFEKYQLVDATDTVELADIEDATIVLKDDNTVEISYPVKDADDVANIIPVTINVGRVADLAGNTTAAFATTITKDLAAATLFVDSAEATDTNTVKITLNDNIADGYINFDQFEIYNGVTQLTAASSEDAVEDDVTVITIDVEEEFDYDVANITVKTVVEAADEDPTTTEYGTDLTTGDTITVDDAVAPEVDSVTLVTTTEVLTIVFKEDVKVKSSDEFLRVAVKLEDANGDEIDFDDYTIDNTTALDTYTIDLAGATLDADQIESITVYLTGGWITDTDDNELADYETEVDGE